MDWHSFWVGLGVGYILHWGLVGIGTWWRGRQFNRALDGLRALGERIGADHRDGRRCEQRECQFCDERERRQRGS